MIASAPPLSAADADAGRRNLRLLILLRWIAVVGQLVTILFVHFVMAVRLPLGPMLSALVLLVMVNIASLSLIERRGTISNRELTIALLIDVAALGWQLHFAGGLTNPFASLFLLHIVLAAILLRGRTSWAILAATVVALALVGLDPVPLSYPDRYAADPFALYIVGSLLCFALIAVLLLLFVTRINRILSERDASLAASRQRAAEEDHIVRIGLLASGAAHELGTPLSSLSVILGDWRRVPAIAADPELSGELAEMQAEVARCKTIVTGILMTAGEARGLASEFTTVRRFLTDVVEDWRHARTGTTIELVDRFGADVAIVSDIALRQVIGNVIDNAVEASPTMIELILSREGEGMRIDVADRGPGFTEAMLAGFGRPYHSTKGRPGGGLGLFLLVNVLRKLGGSAAARNREEGGAVVSLSLPLDAIAARRGAA